MVLPRPPRARRRQQLHQQTLSGTDQPVGVRLSQRACDTIIRAAISGYEAPYKEERLGILLGEVADGAVSVSLAVLYRGGTRSRTKIVVDSNLLSARIKELERRHGLNFLGTFHSHNEVAGKMSSALSHDDKQPLCDDPLPVIEVVAMIWPSTYRPRRGKRYLQLASRGYRIRVASYLFGRWCLLETAVHDGDGVCLPEHLAPTWTSPERAGIRQVGR